MKDLLQIAGGSVPGTTHLLAHKNNHDAYHWITEENWTIALVTDGCGSAPDSEVGAKAGVRLLTTLLQKHIARREKLFNKSSYLTQQAFWQEVYADMLSELRVIGNMLDENLYQIMHRYFLFTVVGTVITKDQTVIFSIGDGWYALNGTLHPINPDEGKYQPYIAYGITGYESEKITPESIFFTVHESIPTSELESLLIGTDGLEDLVASEDEYIPGKEEKIGPISQFWSDDLYFMSGRLQAKLRQLVTSKQKIRWNERRVDKYPGVLTDDTTLITIRTHSKSKQLGKQYILTNDPSTSKKKSGVDKKR